MTEKLIQYDGTKMASLWGGVEDGWVISGQSDTQVADANALYRAIPWMFRGTYLRADNIANMPFAIRKGETDIDTSQDWQNKVGFLPEPGALLWLIEASLTLAGKGYLWREYNRLQTKSLKYITPNSVTYDILPSGEIRWKRDLRDGSGYQDVTDPKSIVNFWLHDPFVEKGAALAYPAAAALSAAGVLFNMDSFVASFFKRGAIKATIFQAEGMGKEDREEFLTWWKKFTTGIRNAFTTRILNAKNMTPVVIGEGIKELENVTLTDDKKKDIAAAFGIPFAILFSDAANFATAQQDKLNFLDNTIVPECRFIESVLNAQIFDPLGYKFEFREETLDAYQQDENERAEALKTYTDAGFPLLMACDILGVELTDDQRKELVAAEKEKEARAAELAASLNKPPAPNSPTVGEHPPAQEPPPNKALTDELAKWERKALKAFNAGKGADVEFISEHIPEGLQVAIHARLASAADADGIRDAFEEKADGQNPPGVVVIKRTPEPQPYDPIAPLIRELRAARLALEAEPVIVMASGVEDKAIDNSPIIAAKLRGKMESIFNAPLSLERSSDAI